MTKSSESVELELEHMNRVNSNHPIDDSQKIVDALSVSKLPTQSESGFISAQLPESNIRELLEQANNNLNFWGILTTPENPYGLLIETSSEVKLVVVFNDSGTVRFAFLEEGLLAEFAIRYTRCLRLRNNNPFWSTTVFAFGERQHQRRR